MPKESLWLVETGGGTGLKITSEPLTEQKSVGSDGRSRYRASLSGRKAKRVVPQRFSPLSLSRDEGVFVFVRTFLRCHCEEAQRADVAISRNRFSN